MNRLVNNSENLGENEPANYTLVSADTLQNTFPHRATEEPDGRLTKEQSVETRGKTSKKTSAPAPRTKRT